MSSTDPAPAALSRPGSAVTRAFPVLMVAVALVLAAWVALGRAAVGLLGSLTPVYAVALALPLLVLHVVAAALLRRDSLNYPSHAVTHRAVATALAAWLVTAAFGFFLPDSTAEGMRSVFTHVAGARYLELGYGFVNILGVLSVALAVALVLLAVTELRVTARRLGGEPLTEDERLDRMEAHGRDDAARSPRVPSHPEPPRHASAAPEAGEPDAEPTSEVRP
ncbi:hypothetical protein [Kocuria sp.]|uniref:hypothetical protein n=1 Tax=Kocuria sp. TaxID=1871328 RepID=UPI0026DA9634|nr:hypothetical protein [Kocuria sp.]MDO4918248.1 hypothetical protein [Kocuria sp.]